MAITIITLGFTDEAMDSFVLKHHVPLEADGITPKMTKAEWVQERLWRAAVKIAEDGKKQDADKAVVFDKNTITKGTIS